MKKLIEQIKLYFYNGEAFIWILASLWLIFSITFNLRIVSSSLGELADFGSFMASGISLRDGENPYGTSSPLIFESYFPLVEAGGKLPNLNPPISLLFFEPASKGNLVLAINIWRVISLIIYILSISILVYIYKPSPIKILWLFSLAGFWHTIGLGQIYTPLLLLITLAWLSLLKNKDGLAGIFLGLLISIKPNFIIWLISLVLVKNWKGLISVAATIVFVGIIPLFFMPFETYFQWLDATGVSDQILAMPGNSSLMGLTSRIGYSGLGVALSILSLVITAIAIYRTRNSETNRVELINGASIFLCLLSSPISWVGYTIFTIPFFLSQSKWNFSTIVAAWMLTMPFNITMHFYYLGSFNFVFWGWWYGLSLLICLTNILILFWKEKKLAQNQPI